MSVLLEQFANLAQTTLNGAITAGATSLVVSSASGFPTTGQFRISIDQEIFIVTAVSGTSFTVTPGAEGTTPANHNTGAQVSLVATAGVMQQLYNHNLGQVNYLEFNPAGRNSFADQTTQLQNWLLYCQLYRKNFKSYTGDDDQLERDYVTAYLPAGIYDISCPLIVPEFVNLKCDGSLQRRGDKGGAVTAFYTGDTTSKALSNVYQPAVICVMNGHCEKVDIMCNPGSNAGSGFYAGKNWVAAGVALAAGGRGYQVGDQLYLMSGSISPYFGTGVTVTSVDGNGQITGCSMAYPGVYALPPILQQQQWTASNGFTVFDTNNPGAYLAGGGSGSGASFTQTWKPDWSTGNTTYYGGSQLIGDTILGHIRVVDVVASTDAAYGSTIGIALANLNFFANELTTNGGDVGISLVNATDVHINFLNPVGANTLLKIQGGGSIECQNCVLDTAAASYVDIDAATSVRIKAQCINPLTSPTLTSGYAYRIGANSNQVNAGVELDIDLVNVGTNAGSPAGYLANMKGCKVDAKVTNFTVGGANGTHLLTRFCDFGPNVDTSNDIRGSFDWGSQTPGSLFGGTLPGCGIRVWNANVNGSGVGGYADEGGNYAIRGTAAPTSGNWKVGDRVVNTAPAASGNLGWINVAAGAPGTWKSYGSISA